MRHVRQPKYHGHLTPWQPGFIVALEVAVNPHAARIVYEADIAILRMMVKL